MKDLVEIMTDEEAMIKMGFKMRGEDEVITENELFTQRGYRNSVSQYSKVVASAFGAGKYITN